MRYLGAHLSVSGGLFKAVETANKHKINSIQIIPTAPIRWAAKEIPQEQIERMAEELSKEGNSVKKILIHGIYLTNLARKDKQLFHMGKLSLLNYLKFASQLEKLTKDMDVEVLGVTFHPGSAQDLSQEESIERISYGLDWILEQEDGSRLLLESAAGAGNVMGDKLEELLQMREGSKYKDRVEYVLDTQHMWASGYDWKGNLEGVISEIENTITIEKIRCFHLNDSLTTLGSNKDRHANLGEGEIGIDAIKAIVKHPELKDIPFIMETPDVKTKGLEKEMGVLLNIAE